MKQLDWFQSPRSGKFVSDFQKTAFLAVMFRVSFNPLDRGNLYQIDDEGAPIYYLIPEGFNPLDRGNLYQIILVERNFSLNFFVSIP